MPPLVQHSLRVQQNKLLRCGAAKRPYPASRRAYGLDRYSTREHRFECGQRRPSIFRVCSATRSERRLLPT